MIIECVKDRIKEAVGLAEKATGKNLSLPILSNILLEAKDKTLTIKSTNLEIGVEVEIPAKIDEEGSVAINAMVFSGFLSNLQKENKIKIESKDGNVKISTNLTSTLIKSLPADDFPLIPKIVNGDNFSLPAQDFIEGLRSVAFAASVSDIKPEIASVYIYKEESNLFFVATDSFRLAEKKINIKGRTKDFTPIIIPARNISEIIRVFDRLNTELQVNADNNQISFFSESIHLTSRIINGTYPDYRQIMPKNFKTEIVITREDLVNNLKIANIFSDKFNQISLKIKAKENILEITALNQEVGENVSTIITEIKGEDTEVSFNVRYIIDCLSVVYQDSLRLQFMEKDKPLLIRGGGDNSFNYIVMPVRSKKE